MPYTKDELQNLPFYQGLITKDEGEYLKLIEKRSQSCSTDDGILRDKKSKNVILFENIVPGQGTDGQSHPENYTISYQGGYWIYEDSEEINKIFAREFTEL